MTSSLLEGASSWIGSGSVGAEHSALSTMMAHRHSRSALRMEEWFTQKFNDIIPNPFGIQNIFNNVIKVSVNIRPVNRTNICSVQFSEIHNHVLKNPIRPTNNKNKVTE